MKAEKNLSDRTARLIAEAIVSVQHKIAVQLKLLEKPYSVRQKKMGLIVFVLICSCYLLIVLSSTLRGVSANQQHFIENSFQKPPLIPPLRPLTDTIKINKH